MTTLTNVFESIFVDGRQRELTVAGVNGGCICKMVSQMSVVYISFIFIAGFY